MNLAVTVVSGLPRSGTSLMMQMLAAGGYPILTDGARAPDEDNPRGYLELEAVKRTTQDSGWVTQAHGKAVKVVYALLGHLPPSHEYRVIMMRRDIGEAVASQRALLERSGRSGASLPPGRLEALFASELERTEAWLRCQQNFRVLHIDYARCIGQTAEAAAAVNAFLGSGLDEKRMVGAVDASLYRQRRAPGGMRATNQTSSSPPLSDWARAASSANIKRETESR